ncbi:hypothetical protein [Fischerella sp. PCC 9605]|uniref:hypothetical protein n=1 Tax=Fischerella sp. PCC 9605 TaxID=1173024 RepID=UPI00047DE464|nr:hypothetical protein [Fischerella sp. PCC 9605]
MPTKTVPRYSANQVVFFLGGMGKILSFQPDSGTWTYAIEMEMGEAPEMGRLGAETIILIHETEIQGVRN